MVDAQVYGKRMLSGAGRPRSRVDDVTAQVDIKGSHMLNWNTRYADIGILFDASEPSGKEGDDRSKQRSKAWASNCDWVESNEVESNEDKAQLLLFIRLQSRLKVHAVHITSFPPESPNHSAGKTTMRPKSIKFFPNLTDMPEFDDAEKFPPAHSVNLAPKDWAEKTGTAEIELPVRKFQSVSSLVVLVDDGNGSGTHVRVDRLRLFGIVAQRMDTADLRNHVSLSNKAWQLFNKYQETGKDSDLEQAIRFAQEAAQTSKDNHPERASFLNNLAMTLHSRYQKTGKPEDLEEACRRMEQAVNASLYDIGGKGTFCGNLGTVLVTKYMKTGNIQDINEAIRNCHEAIQNSKDSHPSRALFLNNLSMALYYRYMKTKKLEDIDSAYRLIKQVKQSPAHHDPEQWRQPSNLCSILLAKHQMTGNFEDLKEAICSARAAVEARQHDGLYQEALLGQLSDLICFSYEKMKSHEVPQELCQIMRKGAETIASNNCLATHIQVAMLQLCDDEACSFSKSRKHLKVEIKLNRLDKSRAVAVSYTWGAFKRSEVPIGHTARGDEVSMTLGEEWEPAEMITTLANICNINGSIYGDGHAACWIDQLCIPQKKDDIRHYLAAIPSIYRRLHTVVLMPGSRCRCLEKLDLADDIQKLGGLCLNSLGVCSYFDRVWTRQELRYCNYVRLVRTSDESLSCVESINDISKLSKYLRLLAHKSPDALDGVKLQIVSLAKAQFALELQNSFFDRGQSRVVEFLLGRDINMREGDRSPEDHITFFLKGLSSLGFSRRRATEPYDYVASVWVDCPGYTLPKDYKKMPLPKLLDNAVRQFENKHQKSIMATAISALFADRSNEPAHLWRPQYQFREGLATSSFDLYGPIIGLQGQMLPISAAEYAQYTPTKESVSLGESTKDYMEQFDGKGEKEVFEALQPVFEAIDLTSKVKAATHVLPGLDQAILDGKLPDVVRNRFLPLDWMCSQTGVTNLPVDHHQAVYELVAWALGLDPEVCKAHKLSLMVSLDSGHPCIGLRRLELRQEKKKDRTRLTILIDPDANVLGRNGRRSHFLLEGYKEDGEVSTYHVTGMWVPHYRDETQQLQVRD